ncbi:sialate O-acetylesterase [Gadus macrocephalus]|uniref:sialate O-acetylesterase n=1 Tax=Gadus macrocephalus TaxID=80720 RepID=UPI0028CB58E8|nr:sialate O-acetylesterase [Gadus macrocephalus]
MRDMHHWISSLISIWCCALPALSSSLCKCEGTLRYASYYGDHMVLQKAPERAVVWGFGPEGVQVNVTLLGPWPQNAPPVNVTEGKWKVTLDPVEAGGPYTVIASMDQLSVNLTDVLFGEVWLCSGQSNMCFETEKVFNAEAELQLTSQYPRVRVFMAGMRQSDQELDDLAAVQQIWSVPTIESVKGFSALCWMFGRLLYADLSTPVGLVQSCWGGTVVETWSSTRALQQCGLEHDIVPRHGSENRNSQLWNAMIHPFLKMTLKGAIWYQGESNTVVNKEVYNCSFPAMIDDWRSSFHEASGGQTALNFPFGFVQLAPGVCRALGLNFNNFASTIRWHQTADTGTAPNPRMKETFMAVAMDLPDNSSPYHPIHPRDKLTVANRLTLGARAVAYGEKDVPFLGPYPQKITFINNSLIITYDQAITVRNGGGFEICCPEVEANCSLESPWKPAPMVNWSSYSVQVSSAACPSSHEVAAVRYAWMDRPCNYKACPVYCSAGSLPAPPFTTTNSVLLGTQAPNFWDRSGEM